MYLSGSAEESSTSSSVTLRWRVASNQRKWWCQRSWGFSYSQNRTRCFCESTPWRAGESELYAPTLQKQPTAEQQPHKLPHRTILQVLEISCNGSPQHMTELMKGLKIVGRKPGTTSARLCLHVLYCFTATSSLASSFGDSWTHRRKFNT